jgi:hypothetical protein
LRLLNRLDKGDEKYPEALTPEAIERDLKVQQYLEKSVRNFHVTKSGKPLNLIDFVPLKRDDKEIQHGALRQKFIKGGVSAADLADLVKKEDKQKLVALGFNSVIDAKEKIRILEEFYIKTDNGVKSFLTKNELGKSQNNAYKPNSPRFRDSVEVGFDYNHGINVMWDPNEKKFVIVDF